MSPRATAESASITTCVSCGFEHVRQGALAQCPRCLLQLGFGRDEQVETAIPIEFSDSEASFDYELLERIGRGGMGVVYRARQRSLNRIVAVKMIAAGEFASPASLARFRREAETAANLDHPNIVSIIDVGEQRSTPYLVMRFVEGSSLAERLAEFTLSPVCPDVAATQSRIAGLIATIARAVDYAHRRGVLHRDLKPSNILLDAARNPHLTDFGIAKSLEDQSGGITQTAELVGTLNYMAPEQAAAKPVGRTADVYSLGAILFELLTGRPPYEGPKMDVLRQVLEEDPQDPRSLDTAIDRDLAIICSKCLDRQPHRRYPTALELAEDLERWQRHEPILARQAGAVLRLRRWVSRNPAVATLMFCLTVGITVSLVLLESANEEKNRKSIALDILRAQSARQLQEIWASSSSAFPIKSETLAAMAGMEVTALSEMEDRFTFGLVSQGNPLAKALSVSSLFHRMEGEMTPMSQPVRLDLILYKQQSNLVQDLRTGSVDFAQLSAIEFLRARNRLADLSPIISMVPNPDAAGVIFTRDQSGIAQLSDLLGKSFLMGTSDSTLSSWAKANLVSAGLRASHFSRIHYTDDPRGNLGADTPQSYSANASYNSIDPIEAVAAGLFDAALVHERRFREVAAEQGLRALARFPDSGDIIVSRQNLPANTVEAFQKAFSSVASRGMSEDFHQAPISFKIAREEDYIDLANRLSAEREFDQ